MNHIPPQVILVAGIAMLAWSVWHMRRKALAARKKNRPQKPGGATSRPDNGNRDDMHGMTREIHALLSDVHETARRCAAQIDNRRVRLEQLLLESEQTIQRLEQSISQAAQHGSARQTRDRPDFESKANDGRLTQVYALADAGTPSQAIAQQLQLPAGEVDLMLGLRSGRESFSTLT